jgi:hypothetical protein
MSKKVFSVSVKKSLWKSVHLKKILFQKKEIRCIACDTPKVYWEKRYIYNNPDGTINYRRSYIEEICQLCEKCNVCEPLPPKILFELGFEKEIY